MRALVVEDEHRIANAVKRGLEQESFAVDVVYDGESGYDLAFTENYDVIILDLMLPKMNGMQVCRQLRENDIQTPVIILTARGEVEDKVEGLNAGADDYLSKPFAFSELLARVRALSRRPKKLLPIKLTVKDLVLNTNDYTVYRDGQSISLTKKEFALLEYLMRNRGRVVTKDQIISNVWNYDADVLPNNVEVYIGYLRNKIDKPFIKSKNLIHTVRGFGYKLE